MNRQYFLAALIVLGMLLVPLAIAPKVQGGVAPPCQAPATICWNNSSGGSWETVANWNLPGAGGPAGRLPTASDDVVLPFIVGGISPYTVTISSVQTVHSILVGLGTALTCSSTCTLTIKSHTPASVALIIGGGLIWVAGFTPAVPLGSADIYGVLNIDGNVVNEASLVDRSPTSIHIDAGGTFVNVNSLDFTGVELTNSGFFVEKCLAVVVGGIALVPGTVVTESPCPTQVSTASGSQVSGTASFSSDLGGFTSLTATAVSSVSPAPPAGLTFPAGLFSFTISGLQVGGTVTVTITLPAPLPAGSFSYWKFHGGTWTQLPATKATLDSTRTVITLTLTDGASPDDSDGLANGVIVDPGGPAITPAIVPEYPLGLPLLAVFMILAYGLIKRRTRNSKNI